MALPRVKSGLPFASLVRFFASIATVPGRSADHPDVRRFEQAFAARYGTDYDAVACCKARMALYHALRAMTLRPDGEVVMTGIHVADFVNIIRLAGFRPIIADIGPGGFQIDMNDLRAKLTDRTTAILVTHLSGYASNMPEIMALAHEKGIAVIEDCSQTMDARLAGQRLGTFGDVAIFSLSLFKSVCTLNGGLVVSRDKAVIDGVRSQVAALAPAAVGDLAMEAIRNVVFKILLAGPVFSCLVFPLLRLLSSTRDHLAGYQKTNKTTIRRASIPAAFLTRYCGAQAEMGLAQLATLEAREKRRRELGTLARKKIDAFAPRILPVAQPGSENGYWLFPILLDDPERVKAALAPHGVDSSRMLLSAVAREPAFAGDDFDAPEAGRVRDSVLFLPMYPDLTEDDIVRIAGTLEAVLTEP